MAAEGFLRADLAPAPRTLLDVLEATALTHGEAPAIDDGSTVLTYAELLVAVRSAAAGLAGAGIGPGDRVGVRIPSGTAELYTAILGVLVIQRVRVRRQSLETLARAHFGDADPIGRRIQCGLDSLDFMTIVGVTADVRTSGPALPATPEIYMPFEQHPGPATSMNIVARSSRDNPLALAETIRRRIATRNADVPVKAFTMEGTLDTASETPRFRTVLLVAFAVVALVLAVAGIYGVMSYTVTQRIPELGVRIALGAAPSSILLLVLRQGAALAATGVAVGLALSLIAGRFMEGLLFGVDADDPLILGAMTLAVADASLAACLIPGRRAVRVDPMVALRAE